jgi:transposase
LPGKEGLTSAEREELTRLRRQVKQLQTERDILAKATAWFASRSDSSATKSSGS